MINHFPFLDQGEAPPTEHIPIGLHLKDGTDLRQVRPKMINTVVVSGISENRTVSGISGKNVSEKRVGYAEYRLYRILMHDGDIGDSSKST